MRIELQVGQAKLLALVAMLFTFGLPSDAAAHIKWFYEYDISEAPRAIGAVLSPSYVHLYIASILAVYAFFWIDRALYRRAFLMDRLGPLAISEDQAFWIMRGATAFLFAALGIYGVTGHAVYLTPELETDIPVVPLIQILLAAIVFVRRLTPVVGLGVFGLYAMAIAEYGVFHLLDYLLFIGLAVFFVFGTRADPSWVKLRYVWLFATTGLTLGWGALEKWAYPQWTYPLLEDRPELLLGFSPDFFMMSAGFVEFNIAFVLLGAASVASRLVALGLNVIFLFAVWLFGMIDAVGHAILIAVLLVLTLRGPTSARYFLVLSDKSLWAEAYFLTGLCILAINVLFIAYYGLHSLLVS